LKSKINVKEQMYYFLGLLNNWCILFIIGTRYVDYSTNLFFFLLIYETKNSIEYELDKFFILVRD
jgi:hypothetical protein